MLIKIKLIVNSHPKKVQWLLPREGEPMISRPQDHGVVFIRVDDHTILSVPLVCYLDLQSHAAAHRLRTRGSSLSWYGSQQVIQKDVEEHRTEHTALRKSSANRLPSWESITNFDPLQSAVQVVSEHCHWDRTPSASQVVEGAESYRMPSIDPWIRPQPAPSSRDLPTSPQSV